MSFEVFPFTNANTEEVAVKVFNHLQTEMATPSWLLQDPLASTCFVCLARAILCSFSAELNSAVANSISIAIRHDGLLLLLLLMHKIGLHHYKVYTSCFIV